MSNLTVQAPQGAHFEYEEVKTQHGQKSLGERPILVWDNVQAALGHYGEEQVLGVLDGTSFRVSFQGIARRMAIAGKSDDEIATAQVEFKPGTRQVGQATPTSRAARAARQAAEKVDGDAIAALLQKIAAGEISADDVKALVG